MVSVVDLIDGVTIMCKSRKIAERVVAEHLARHRSSYALERGGIKMAVNAYVDDRGDTIYIRRRG